MDTSRQRSTSKTLEEWIELYNKKVPGGFKRDKRFTLFYLAEKGFAEIRVSDTTIIIWQTCGELKFWRFFAETLARKLGYKSLETFFVRPIKPYIRLTGFVPYRIEKTSQGDRYFGKDKNTGQKGQASPAGDGTYYFTWEVPTDGL